MRGPAPKNRLTRDVLLCTRSRRGGAVSQKSDNQRWIRAVSALLAIAASAGCQSTSEPVSTVADLGASVDVAQPLDAATPDLGSPGEDLPPTETAAPETTACTPGTKACPCAPDGACGAGLSCVAQLCQPTALACSPGSTGCKCKKGSTCDKKADLCTSNVCVDSGCAPGAVNCPCNAGACAEGLVCTEAGICVSNTGSLGGLCFSDGTCTLGNRCQGGFCVPCQLGSLGCACSAGKCNPALGCAGGVCVKPESPSLVPPPSPKCYTHCSTGITKKDKSYVPCPSDGWMEGCLDDLECVLGSCVTPGEQPPTCVSSDSECPEHQHCVAGTCYSNCDAASPCAAGKSCFNHVCRLTCPADGAPCPKGSSCNNAIGGGAVCLPDAGVLDGADKQTSVTGDIQLSTRLVHFSNLADSAVITLTNNGDAYASVGVRKLRHKLFLADATTETQNLDADDDQVQDTSDNCPYVVNEDQLNTDGDSLGNACDPDDDNDGFADIKDVCPWAKNPLQTDADSDGVGDACVGDQDGDGVLDATDTCPTVVNPAQEASACAAPLAQFTCNPTKDCPLFWLKMGPVGLESVAETIQVEIPPHDSVKLSVTNAGGTSAVRWTGALDIVHPRLNGGRVELTFDTKPDGQWTGTAHYFADFGTSNVETWAALPNPTPGGGEAGTKNDVSVVNNVGNALIQRWTAFRRGKITFKEFQAVLTATETESWRNPELVAKCGKSAVCYPTSETTSGIATYSDNAQTAPVPTAIVSHPMAINVRVLDGNPTTMTGRIESATAMHYAGNPGIAIAFSGAVASCPTTLPTACLNFVTALEADVDVGGRYTSHGVSGACAQLGGADALRALPWLVPGFERATSVEPSTGSVYRHECEEAAFPYPTTGVPAEQKQALRSQNRNLARANPIPDGRVRHRELRVLDGAMINQSQLFVLFKERFDSFLGEDDPDGFSAYGYMVLQRQNVTVDLKDGNGNQVPDFFEGTQYTGKSSFDQPKGVLDVGCPAELVSSYMNGLKSPPAQYYPQNAAATAPQLARLLVEGTVDAVPISPAVEAVHTYCQDTKKFDAGRTAENVPCPAGSEVLYFTVDATNKTQPVRDHPCQDTGDCRQVLEKWLGTPFLKQLRPAWKCTDASKAYCDDNRSDLTAGKTFFQALNSDKLKAPLRAEIDSAFRYTTRFRNRQGQGIGFAPSVCVPDSDEIPYCYDPAVIEATRERTDCLVHLWKTHWSELDAVCWSGSGAGCERVSERLTKVLAENFSSTKETAEQSFDLAKSRGGFERLYSELLIMMGDESYTRSFASRFDLAGASTAGFEGTSFEDQGINLSGITGFEMVTLYQAVQYYQEALDRFYALSPTIWSALPKPPNFTPKASNFVTADMVVTYFDRLVRASTQKTRAMNEIAKRYQQLDRNDLARRVIERAYNAAYLESVVMARMMLRIITVSKLEYVDQIKRAIRDAQLRFRTALLDMRNVYANIQDNVNYFGVPADFIPFPTVDAKETTFANAFEQMMIRLKAKLSLAKEREDVAIQSKRTFDTDAAEFQSELVSIRNTHENQLTDICGTFTALDGVVYPAIAKYAHLSPGTAVTGDPCGLMGTGQIHEEIAQADLLGKDFQRLTVELDNVTEEADIQIKLGLAQCKAIGDFKDQVISISGKKTTLNKEIQENELAMKLAQMGVDLAQALAGFSQVNCGPDNLVGCAAAGVVYTGLGIAMAGNVVAQGLLQNEVNKRTLELASLDVDQVTFELDKECQIASAQTGASAATVLLQIPVKRIELLRSAYELQLQASKILQLRNKAKRLQAQEEEASQLAIATQAAKNDPNIRIYKNDAIINADVAFEAALTEAWRTTLVLEYYTSQSYAGREKLFLTRMVSRGDTNLEDYVANLQNAFYDFEDFFGLPESRVIRLSLKDDILQVPWQDTNGQALSDAERTERLRTALRDPARLDPNGYLVFPFTTEIKKLSPLTRNHKILWIEVDLRLSSSTDNLARVYLRPRGTSTIHGVENTFRYHRLPPHIAVINAKISGSMGVFDPSVFKSARLRDRPLANSHWELTINQRDEYVNQDIDLQSCTDIYIDIYYSDFTQL